MFPDWSPDGQRIAFQRARQRGTRWFSVWAIDLVGDEARHPTELAYSDTSACIAPRWSPDGTTIVYCAVRQTAQPKDDTIDLPADVWLVDARAGTRLKLTDGAAGAFNPTWANSGRIYFVSARSGVENIWSLEAQLGSYPVGRDVGRESKLSRALANTPVETGGK
jgi:Tol biopolymer transport system component